MVDELIPANESRALVVRRASVALEPVMDVQHALDRLAKLQEFCAHYLQESSDGGNDGGDYGIIPGAGKKKVLLKSGADKLCDVYALADTYLILTQVNDWERGLFEYTVECRLQSKVDDSLVGSGLGSCSSFEAKYRYRAGGRKCPACGKDDTIIKGKSEYGGGWICFAKKGGCGAKFKDGDKTIEGQNVGRVDNPDIVDTRNTVLKMAKKRAKIDAVIGVTRSSGIFTQDLDEQTIHVPSQPEASTPANPSSKGETQFYSGIYEGSATHTRGGKTVTEVTIDGQVFSTIDPIVARAAASFAAHARVSVTFAQTARGGLKLLSIAPETVQQELTAEEVGF